MSDERASTGENREEEPREHVVMFRVSHSSMVQESHSSMVQEKKIAAVVDTGYSRRSNH